MNKEDKDDYEGPHYILNHQLLKTGDIILEKGYAWYSDEICRKTGGYYSHAMIFITGTIIEATQAGGVYSRIPNRSTVRAKQDFKVLRLKKPLNPEQAELLCSYARSLSGSKYSIKEAIQAGLPQKMRAVNTDSRKQFCSRLVAQVYKKIGVELVRNINFCSPKDIEDSDLLYEVTGMTRLANPAEIAHTKGHSQHDDHVECVNKYVDLAIEVLLKNKIKTIGQTDGEVIITTINDISVAMYQNKENLKLDSELTEAMITTGFYDDTNPDKIKNPHRYDDNKFTQYVNSIADGNPLTIIKFLHDEIHENIIALGHRLTSYDHARQNSSLGLKFTDLELKTTTTTLKGYLDRIVTLERYTSDKRHIKPFYDMNECCKKHIKIIRQHAPNL